MAQTLLTTKAAILLLWPQLDHNISEAKANSYILRSQQADLKPLIGAALYHDVTTNPGTTENALLISGGEYTYKGNVIFFSGINDYLAASSYARLLNGLSTNAGRAGVVQKQTEQSTDLTKDVVKQRSRETESEAIRLQAELVQFLQQNESDYPLWEDRESDEAQKRTSFRITKVPRHRQR